MTRLIQQFRDTGSICDRRDAPAWPFPRRYTQAGSHPLAEVDVLHGARLAPLPLRKLCERAYGVTMTRRALSGSISANGANRIWAAALASCASMAKILPCSSPCGSTSGRPKSLRRFCRSFKGISTASRASTTSTWPTRSPRSSSSTRSNASPGASYCRWCSRSPHLTLRGSLSPAHAEPTRIP